MKTGNQKKICTTHPKDDSGLPEVYRLLLEVKCPGGSNSGFGSNGHAPAAPTQVPGLVPRSLQVASPPAPDSGHCFNSGSDSGLMLNTLAVPALPQGKMLPLRVLRLRHYITAQRGSFTGQNGALQHSSLYKWLRMGSRMPPPNPRHVTEGAGASKPVVSFNYGKPLTGPLLEAKWESSLPCPHSDSGMAF